MGTNDDMVYSSSVGKELEGVPINTRNKRNLDKKKSKKGKK
jgi:hypothetical protein